MQGNQIFPVVFKEILQMHTVELSVVTAEQSQMTGRVQDLRSFVIGHWNRVTVLNQIAVQNIQPKKFFCIIPGFKAVIPNFVCLGSCCITGFLRNRSNGYLVCGTDPEKSIQILIR